MRQLGRYRLDRVLGSGAFATVWKGYDPELETVVAVKLLADNWAVDADVRERFLAEARLLRRIESPRVVRVHDVGVETLDRGVLAPGTTFDPAGQAIDRPYFVMDYIDGGTLADRIGRLSAWQATYFAAEAAEAVQVLHDAGVLHRDIKPSNFLLDSSGDLPRVLVADLGSAKMAVDASQITVITGTPAYMAPEQAGSAGGFDGRADVYALAVVSYELLSGRRPFEELSPTSLLLRTAGPAPLTATGLPDRIDTLMAVSLSPDPARRPASPHAFAEALVASADHGQDVQDPESRAGQKRDWPLPLVLAAAVLVFLLAALVAWLQ